MPRVPVNLFVEELREGVRRTQPAEEAISAGGLVEAVRPGTLAAAAGIRPGARVLAANGRLLRDVVDYQFYTAESDVVLRIQEPDGTERDIPFRKWPDDDLGVEFAEATWDGVRICTNTCPFCFLKGLPRGMRRTLYVKDDDYRLSFLHGNFVTLTNLTEADWQRLDEQRLSPLHVSVHATELGLRRRLLGYRDAPDIIEQLRRLAALRIQSHTQVVLCPGVNDEAHLDRTVSDLGALYPAVQSIAIVPVGATMQFEQRMGLSGRALEETRACSPAYARQIVRQVTGWQRRFWAEHGASIVQAADEYYLIAGARVPAAARYDGFTQYENGIGMTRVLLDDWHDTRRQLRRALAAGERLPGPPPRLTAGAGALIAPTLVRLFAELDALLGTQSQVVPVTNHRFGARINVSGLLPGEDFIGALRNDQASDLVILPRASLDYFGRKFLDDQTPADVEAALGRPVRFASGMSEVVRHVLQHCAGVAAAPPSLPSATNGKFWATRA